MLLEDMADQQLKEIVIAYAMLFLAGADEGGGSLHDRDAGLTEAQLDRRCEDFMVEHFGLKVNEVSAASCQLEGKAFSVPMDVHIRGSSGTFLRRPEC